MPLTFDFCPERHVPETLPPDPQQGVTMNGWQFVSRPEVPFQRKFKLTLYGLRWYLDNDDHYDATTNPEFNARRLEMFYQAHQTWLPFEFTHQHFSDGPILCRFAAPLVVPASPPGSGGWLDPLEAVLIHHNPGY